MLPNSKRHTAKLKIYDNSTQHPFGNHERRAELLAEPIHYLKSLIISAWKDTEQATLRRLQKLPRQFLTLQDHPARQLN